MGANDEDRECCGDEIERYSLRIPASLLCQIREKAKRNRRSVNAEIMTVLEGYVVAHENMVSDLSGPGGYGAEQFRQAASI